MSQETKARELVARADKKLNSWMSSFMGNKYEDAEELYKAAANQFKAAKLWDEAGDTFEKVAACHLKLKSPHEVATAYQDAAVCYRKTNIDAAVRCYTQTSEIHIELGRFTSAAKVQKEIGELYEAEGNNASALTAFQSAAEYYAAEESHSQANQVLLKVAGLAAGAQDFNRAIEIYEQVAIASLESNLLRFSVKGYLLSAGICRLATGEIGAAVNALERYEGMDASFATTREGQFLRALVTAYEAMDEEAFTDVVREYDEVSRLDAQKTTLLLEVKKKIKAATDDIT
mmetsp:Transcript_837/g.2307  ORF Transcript_837/g.2307 Transcript_837/m.2307 type:complete len:288 (-) Transcript_837:684-1547(-)